MKTLCIIPARGGSKRFPRKNIALLRGKPLLQYAIEVAKQSGVFHAVCVTSEDEEILTLATKHGADIVHRRSPGLASDSAQLKKVCVYLLETYAANGQSYDAFGLIIPTSPLRTAEDVRSAYELLQSPEADSVMSLTRFIHPPQSATRIDRGYVCLRFGVTGTKQSQAQEPLYHHDGVIIFCKTEAFLREPEFYGKCVVPYFTPPERSVDIDVPLDMEWAEFLLSRQKQGS